MKTTAKLVNVKGTELPKSSHDIEGIDHGSTQDLSASPEPSRSIDDQSCDVMGYGQLKARFVDLVTVVGVQWQPALHVLRLLPSPDPE